MIIFGIIWKNEKDPMRVHALESYYNNNITYKHYATEQPLFSLYCGTNSKSDYDQVICCQNIIIIGRVFDKISHKALTAAHFANHTDSISLLEKNGWGKYIAFHLQDNNFIQILRDALGQLEFYYRELPNVGIIFSSQIRVIYQILKEKPQMHSDFIKSYLLYGNDFIPTHSPFTHISELPPGFRLNVKKGKSEIQKFYDPFTSFIQSQDLSSTKYQSNTINASNSIVETLENTVKAWVAPYKNLMISLSGGLDSSSLAFCLSQVLQSDQTLKAVNVFHSDIASSDERTHARKVCEKIGIEIVELDFSNYLPFNIQKTLNYDPNYPQPTVLMGQTAMLSEMMRKEPSSLWINGNGGDHLFMLPPPQYALADYFLEHGFKGIIQELYQLAFYYREPFYKIIEQNIFGLMKHYLRMNTVKAYSLIEGHGAWLSKEVLNFSTKVMHHPIYLDIQTRLPPGKLEQIRNFYRALPSLYRDHDDYLNPTFYPLMLQPNVELALQIPSYRLCQQGYDRYPFRKAISERYKTELVWRRDKGESSGVFQLGVKKHLKDLQSLCLEGYLAKNGWFNKDQFNAELCKIANGEDINLWPSIYLMTFEYFYSHWSRINYLT